MRPSELPRVDDWRPGVAAEGAFSAAECDRVLAMVQNYEPGRVDGGERDDGLRGHRDCQVSWITPQTPDSGWLFQKAADIIGQANRSFYDLDLFGYTERLQVTRYEVGHFQDWHMDFGPGRYSVRKLSFVVQLSDPADYEGGDFEVLAYYDPAGFPKTRGTIIFFPTFVLHRVKPVTAGTRYSLVGWIGGPHYR